MEKISKDMEALLNRYACGEVSEEEKEQAREFLVSTPACLQQFLQMVRVNTMKELNLSVEDDPFDPERFSGKPVKGVAHVLVPGAAVKSDCRMPVRSVLQMLEQLIWEETKK